MIMHMNVKYITTLREEKKGFTTFYEVKWEC